MQSEDDAASEVRLRSTVGVAGVTAPPLGLGEPLLREEGAGRWRRVTRALTAVVLVLLIALVAYESFIAPKDDDGTWTPPPGLSVKETPVWLQALCAERTRELCLAADRARNPSDCDALRATLRKLEALEADLSARGAISPRQHWVLTELYGQGHQLCRFTRRAPPAK